MKGRSYAVLCFALIAILSVPGYSKTVTKKRSTHKTLQLNADNKYVVQRGDNLSRIAKAFNTTAEQLSSANRLRSSRIKPGQLLAIPGTGPAAAVPVKAAATTTISTVALVNKAGKTGPEVSAEEKPMRHRLVEAGFNLLGVRYRRGGTGSSGFDCSGLVKNLFSRFDIELPRSSREQFLHGEKVGRDELEVGDLVFFSSGGTQPTHVGIYVGDNKFLHAAVKAKRVIVSDLNKIWYAMRYLGARRVKDLWGDEPFQSE